MSVLRWSTLLGVGWLRVQGLVLISLNSVLRKTGVFQKDSHWHPDSYVELVFLVLIRSVFDRIIIVIDGHPSTPQLPTFMRQSLQTIYVIEHLPFPLSTPVVHHQSMLGEE